MRAGSALITRIGERLVPAWNLILRSDSIVCRDEEDVVVEEFGNSGFRNAESGRYKASCECKDPPPRNAKWARSDSDLKRHKPTACGFHGEPRVRNSGNGSSRPTPLSGCMRAQEHGLLPFLLTHKILHHGRAF